MSTNKHNGQALKSMLKEQNVSVTKMVELSGRNRQQIHNDFNRVTIKDDVLLVYAAALGMSIGELRNYMVEQKNDPSDYLLEHLTSLESQFKALVQLLEVQNQQLLVKDEQLQTKDKQIEKLIDILGKAEGVTTQKTVPIFKLHSDAQLASAV